MKYVFLSLGILISLAFSDSAKYEANFSFLGKIAQAQISRTISKNDYIIEAKALAVGLAASLSKNKYETYISQGKVKKGILVPDVLTIVRGDDSQVIYTIFKFDHEAKRIVKEQTEKKYISESTLDLSALRIITKTKEHFTHGSGENDYYAQNDIVSLFFNAVGEVKQMRRNESKTLYAVGIKTENGQVTIRTPSTVQLARWQKLIPVFSDNNFFSIGVAKEIFEDENGALIVNADADGFPREAVMENIIMFGDARGVRVYDSLSSASNGL